MTLVSFVLLAGVVGLLMFNTSMQQASFAATTLEQQAATLDAREQTLQMELDVLRDPQRVALKAQRMGMVSRRRPAFLGWPTARCSARRRPRRATTRCACSPQAAQEAGGPRPARRNVVTVTASRRDRRGDDGAGTGARHGKNKHQQQPAADGNR